MESPSKEHEEATSLSWLSGSLRINNSKKDDQMKSKGTVNITVEELEALMDARVSREREELEVLMDARLDARVKTAEASMVELFKKEHDLNKPAPNPPCLEKRESAIKEEEEMKGLVDDKPEEEEVEMHSPFGENVYTAMYMHEFCSQSFWYAMFVCGLQIAVISLTLADQFNLQDEDNPLNVPAMVSVEVTIAQFLALFMLLAYVSDLIEAVLKLQDGFHSEVLQQHPGATFPTWLFSCLAQLTVGLLLVLASLILTMTAETVIDVMLNLTALLFITELDDLGFLLAQMGFLTTQLKEQAEACMDVQVRKRNEHKYVYKRILYFLILLVLLVGYGVIKDKQLNGEFLPTHLFVQFGDAYNHKIPFYSGVMSSKNVRTFLRRQYRDRQTGKILLAYCDAESAWTLSEGDDPCEYDAKTHETKSYDVSSIPDSVWEVKDSRNRLQPFVQFSLINGDCQPETCQGNCTDDGLCQCPHDRFGLDCGFKDIPDVCPELLIDARFLPFPPVKYSADLVFGMSDEFHMLVNDITMEYVKFNQLPVYYSNQTYPANVVFFSGRRWIITSEFDFINLAQAKSEHPTKWSFPEKTVAAFENGFHSHYNATYTPFFVSDPVDFDTPNFQPTPNGIRWMTVEKRSNGTRNYVPDAPLEAVLECHAATCVGKPEAFCGYGWCDKDNGHCMCDEGYEGKMCEVQMSCDDQSRQCGGHGSCEGGGICHCNLPWYGKLCEQSYKCYEEYGSCKNGGICNMTTGDCDCPGDAAISGESCEERMGCNIYNCQNGGLCASANGNGNCICRPPFMGTLCDLVNRTQVEFFCSSDEDCLNGMCNAENGICTCNDPNRYGTLCEHTYNCSAWYAGFWELTPCLNSGTCNAGTGLCDCPEPFFGPDCGQVPPCVSDDDCGRASFSFDTCNVESGECNCISSQARGKRCEKNPTCETDEDCFNGGVCSRDWSCQCPHGFGGWLCESFIAGGYSAELERNQLALEANVTLCGIEDPFCLSR